jgi:cell division protein FtsQ
MPAVRAASRAGARTGAKTRTPSRARRRSRATLGMKLGAWARAQVRSVHYRKESRLAVAALAIAAVLGLGGLLAVASGAADDAGKAIASATAGAARGAGLAVRQVTPQAPDGGPLTEARRAQVLEAAAVPPGGVMFAIDPGAIRARVEKLAWVESARVLRLWPDQLVIIATPRRPVALWQKDGRFAMIDGSGAALSGFAARPVSGLPLVVGAEAGAAAPALLAALGARPAIQERTAAAIYVDARRWTLQLASGASVLLPAQGIEGALDQLVALQADMGLLDRPLDRIDLRHKGALLVRLRGEESPAAPAPNPV